MMLADPPENPPRRQDTSGLTSREVAERLRGGAADHRPRVSRSLWDIVRKNVFTLFNAIVVGSFLLLLSLGQWRDALFGFAAISNSIIGVTQEYRAKRQLDALAIVDAAYARVRRDDIVREIPRENVVVDDVLVLRTGDQLTVDAVVLSAEMLEVDESLLTGESEPVVRRLGMNLLSGSMIVSGRGEGRVIHVGAGSFANRLELQAKRYSLVNSEIRRSIDRVLRWVTVALVPVMMIVVNGQMQALGGWGRAIATGTWRDGAAGAVASVIAMVPLGLVLIASVAFTLGSMRLARQAVLVQEIAAVEVLARVDILCLDKTGTLTQRHMSFDSTCTLGDPPDGWREALGWFGADPEANATARSLSAAFAPDPSVRPTRSVGFSSARKWSALTFEAGATCAGTWVLGDPGIVFEGTAPGTAHALADASVRAAAGRRTLALARTDEALPSDPPSTLILPPDLVPVAVLTLREQVRPEARAALAYFRDEGVGVRIISGDSPETVAAIARDVGLEISAGYDATRLLDDPDELADVLERNLVFGRVTPAQKKDMIAALRRRGHVVAMTGDGINDVPALREADIGIAMDTAAPATKAASRLVLLDGRFDRLPSVVAEGRRAIANLERISVLFLSKTTYAMAISVVFGLLLWSFPLLPRQLFITDGPTIGIPAFFLALLMSERRYRSGYLKRVLWLAVPIGIVITVTIYLVNGYARSFGADAEMRSATVLVLGFGAMWVLVVSIRPLDGLRLLMLAAMYSILILLFLVPATADFFAIAWPSPPLLRVSLGAGIAACIGVEIVFRVHARQFRSGR